MPIPKPCIVRRCPEYAVNGPRCEKHAAEWEAKRRADPAVTGRRGTSSEWRRARGLSLYRHGHQCQRCDAKAVDVHHKDGDASNNRQSNLEPLCADCHKRAHKSELSRSG